MQTHRSVDIKHYLDLWPFVDIFIANNHLFLLGDPFSTLRSHLNGREGLVIADPTEEKKNNVILSSLFIDSYLRCLWYKY